MCKICPIGLINNKTTAKIGVTNDDFNEGKWLVSVSLSSMISASKTLSPLFFSIIAMNVAANKPNNAGIKSAIIKWLISNPNPFAAAIVFGLGEIKFPAFPPPESATSNANFEIPIRWPISNAIGATIKIATGIKTPTAVIIITAKVMANIAKCSPSLFTTVRANVSAAPDSIITPARRPAAITRTTVPITDCVPVITNDVVCTKLAPPINAPTTAPINSAYTGFNFFKIKIIASASPSKAPHHVTIAVAIFNLLFNL